MSFNSEPHWLPYRKFRHDRVPSGLLDWLLTSGSLTGRLRQHCNVLRVELLRQSWSSVFLSERKSLAIPERQRANVREVKLICDGKPWVFARTVIPAQTLTGPERNLLTLGTTPLGQILFEHPDMRRSEFEFATIKPEHHYFNLAEGFECKADLYGRRSIFYLSGKPLLVTEVFTPYCASLLK